MTLTALFFTSFLMGLSGAMVPGPLLTVNINDSFRRGFWVGPLLIFGHALLEITLVIGLIKGLDRLLLEPVFKGCITLFGGMVLLWMGWGMLKDAWLKRVTLELAAQNDSGGMPPILAGVIVSVANPYWVLWWATIGLTYVTLAMQIGTIALTVFMTGHLLADLSWYSAVSFGVVSGKKFINEQVYRVIILVCGLFLCGLALYFIWSGKTFLFGF
jgi:threonine/homoserine/homoserine lactone efflux protein